MSAAARVDGLRELDESAALARAWIARRRSLFDPMNTLAARTEWPQRDLIERLVALGVVSARLWTGLVGG